MQVNEKAIRGGFFGGYPIILNNLSNIKEIEENFKNSKIRLLPNPWMQHHKMEVYNKEECILKNTEDLDKKFYIIGVPYFLNFNFKALENCLKDCEKIVN